MISVNELRIGNFVNRLYESGSITDGVYQYTVCVDTFCFNNELGEPLFTDLFPIPLTEEWLVKFGFTGWDLGYYTLLMDRGVFFILTEDGMTIISRNVKYVHQLQNLYFALTGEELIFTP